MTDSGAHQTIAPNPAATRTMSRRRQIILQPHVLRWARERASLTPEKLADKMNVDPERVLEWEQSGQISIARADRLAARTYTPLGYLYLSDPPDETLPIRDFRTPSGATPQRPSPNLLDTVYQMQRRQAWMRDELIENEEDPQPFVGAYSLTDSHIEVAAAMRAALGLDAGWAEERRSWSEALSFLRNRLDQVGILVVFNGVVGNNTSRILDPAEFQGFALVDEFAPLIFINSSDYIAAQIFTLAHEVAHLFAGATGLTLFDRLLPPNNRTERFCNHVAAEFLVPAQELHAYWPSFRLQDNPYQKIARRFKVSAIVAARRALDLELIDTNAFFNFYENNKEQGRTRPTAKPSGNFWNTQRWRIGPSFAAAVARAAKEGRLPYREAYSLTDLKGDTFEQMPQKMAIIL